MISLTPAGLILAGSADFKTELSQSDMFDPRLQAKVIKLVDVSYGGENGFNQVTKYILRRTGIQSYPSLATKT
jgi:peptide subunit release factor 1 (eRF1)